MPYSRLRYWTIVTVSCLLLTANALSGFVLHDTKFVGANIGVGFLLGSLFGNFLVHHREAKRREQERKRVKQPSASDLLSVALKGLRTDDPEPPTVARGTVFGWKRWGIADAGSGPYLISIGNMTRGATAWTPEMSAHCQSVWHPAPANGCSCGLYAWDTVADALDHRDYGIAIGLIEGWGKVIHHEHGWRSEYARVVALIATDVTAPLIRRLAAHYGADVIHTRPWDAAIRQSVTEYLTEKARAA